MALWGERQVKRDLGIVDRRRKQQTFDKLFQTPPHVEYIAREPKTAARLRRLMGSNVVELSNCYYMDKLEHHTVRMHREDLQVRIEERARQAAQLAHLQLWESVLRGESTLPPEKLDDPCMREVRRHQLKIEALQQKADKLGTSVLRVATIPNVWTEPSRYKPPPRKESVPSPVPIQAKRPRRLRSRFCLRTPSPSLYGSESHMPVAAGDHSTTAVGRADSFHSRRMVVKWSDDARAKRSKSVGCCPSAGFGHQYRRLTGESDLEIHYTKPKRLMIASHEMLAPRDRRRSRINPPSRPPVVFPDGSPQLRLLSCDIDHGRVVMKPLGTSDFIIPRYYRPKAPDILRHAKNLDELYRTANLLFYMPYPTVDNREWDMVYSSRVEQKLEQMKKDQEKKLPMKCIRFV